MGGSKKIFLYPPKKLLVSVFGGGSKKLKLALHEILTDIKSQISQQPLVLQGKNLYILVDI